MSKKELKKQYKDLEINLVDILSELDTTKTNKLTPFIVKQFHNDWFVNGGDYKNSLFEEWFPFKMVKNKIDLTLKEQIGYWFKDKTELLNDFIDHLENKRLEDNDINNYGDWDKISLAVNEANLKTDNKSKKNRIITLHNDPEWLIIKPLSIESSVNYGFGTRWCTAMKNNSDYFYRYSRHGILIYVINKVTGQKYGYYSSPDENSVWNKEDLRIDSLSTSIPMDLLSKLREWTDLNNNGVNYDHFQEEDKEKTFKLMSKGFEYDMNRTEEIVDEALLDVRGNYYEDRILNDEDNIITNNRGGLVQPLTNWGLDVTEEATTHGF